MALSAASLGAGRTGTHLELVELPPAQIRTHVDRSERSTPRLLEIGGATIAKRVHPKKVAVVTGANRGMGLETCRQLARAGFTVVLTSRDAKAGKAAALALRGEGLDVVYQRLDVTNPRSASSLAGFLRHTYGRADVLVNNAGAIFEDISKGESLSDVPPAVLKQTLDVNTHGPIQVARALIGLMKERGEGQIINLTSELAAPDQVNEPGAPAYRLSKAMLETAGKMLAEELQGTGISVNAVIPGWVRTAMGGASAPLTVEQGVDTTIWLATRANEERTTGDVYRDRAKI
jgi:NAD(P)-dependent dehydrogenase (short-subunit alcohol dehydrogenase family)